MNARLVSLAKTLEPQWLRVWRLKRRVASLLFQIDLMEAATESREPHKALATMRAQLLCLRKDLLALGVSTK